jgi:hypothetical protein
MANRILLKLTRILIVLIIPAGFVSCTNNDAAHNTLSRSEQRDGWMLLFDGETSQGWRGYNRADFPEGWLVEDGTLFCKGSGGDVIYDRQFLNFHLKIDWKISEGGNSGVFILAHEIPGRAIWQTAPEIQIIDNENQGLNPSQYAPALYDLAPPAVQNTRPAGEWNALEIILNEGHLTIRQNGEDAVQIQMDTPEWDELVEKSKFPSEIFGKLEPGFIGVQDHRDEVWFRNIKLKEF